MNNWTCSFLQGSPLPVRSRLWTRSRTGGAAPDSSFASARQDGRLPGSHGLGHTAVPSCPQLFSSGQRNDPVGAMHRRMSRPFPCAAVDRALPAAVCESVSRWHVNPRRGDDATEEEGDIALAVSASASQALAAAVTCLLGATAPSINNTPAPRPPYRPPHCTNGRRGLDLAFCMMNGV